MGRNVIAYLAFGGDFTGDAVDTLPWDPFGRGEDGEFSDGEDEIHEPKLSFEYWITKISGLDDPSADIPDRDESWPSWYTVPENERAMGEFWRRQRELVSECPITEVVYYYDEPGLLVAVNGTVNQASWAEPMEPTIAVDDAKLEAAKAFCAEHGIPFEDPKWILVAYSDS